MEVEIGRGKKGRRAYGFDDIAIVPSRRTRDAEDVEIAWRLGPHTLELPLLASAMEMLIGGAGMLLIALLRGEFTQLASSSMSMRSALSIVYLAGFGSIIAFSAYKWLLSRVSPALVGTYAFVNPVVAVALGWAFASEALTSRTLLAMAVIVGAVVMISLKPRHLVLVDPAE